MDALLFSRLWKTVGIPCLQDIELTAGCWNMGTMHLQKKKCKNLFHFGDLQQSVCIFTTSFIICLKLDL